MRTQQAIAIARAKAQHNGWDRKDHETAEGHKADARKASERQQMDTQQTNTPTPEQIDRAKAAYTRYGDQISSWVVTEFKNFRGDTIPSWEALPAQIQKAWIAAAEPGRCRDCEYFDRICADRGDCMYLRHTTCGLATVEGVTDGFGCVHFEAKKEGGLTTSQARRTASQRNVDHYEEMERLAALEKARR